MVWHWDVKGESLEVGGADESKKPGAWPAYQAEYLRTRLRDGTGQYNAGSLVDEEKEVFLHNAAKNFEAEADEALKAEFQSWLKGSHEINFSRPEQRTYANGSGKTPRLNTYRVDPSGAVRDPLELKDDWEHTSWGNKPLTNLPGVRDYLENIEKKKQSAHLNLNLLAEHGPSNLEEAWQYFKTWVKARPTSDSLQLHIDHGPDPVQRPAGPMDWGAPRRYYNGINYAVEDTHKQKATGGIDNAGPLPFSGRPNHHEDVPVYLNIDSEVRERILNDPRSFEPGFSERVWGEYARQLFNNKEMHTYAGYASGNDPVAEREAFIKAHWDNPNFAELFRRWQYGVDVFEGDDDDLESVPSLSEDEDLGLDEDDYEEMADDEVEPLIAWIAALNKTADSPGFVDLLFDGPPYKNLPGPGGKYMNYHQYGVDPNNPERDTAKYKPEQDTAAGHVSGIWLKRIADNYNKQLRQGVAPDDRSVYMLWKSYALNANYIWKRLAGANTLSGHPASYVLEMVEPIPHFSELGKRPFIPDGTMPEYDLFHVPIPAGVDLTNMSYASFKQFVKKGYIPNALPAD